ncbi:MAG: hypothetical protein AABO58_07445 [Acidobacteriota bacterium]
MRVPLCVLAVCAPLLLSACASAPASDTSGSASTTTTAAATPAKKPAEPVISIARLDVNSAQPKTATSVPMVVRVKVENRTEEPVTVDRIDVGSMGVGPYTITSTSQNFHHEVKIGHASVFPVWVQATPTPLDDTIGGQEGKMMMRLSVYVTTPTRPQHRLTQTERVDTSLSH